MTKDDCTKEKHNENDMTLGTKHSSFSFCSSCYKYLLSYLYIFI